MDSRQTYRSGKQVLQNITKEELSTGTALIRTKVDTWMTFEEYERLTSKHAGKYRHHNRKTDPNAFWPGQLLHKLRLCMPPYDSAPQLHPTGPIFTSVRPTRKTNPGYDNDISYWPVSNTGYMQNGSIDKY
ncbi:hypothetical protein LOTGIDRAFT_134763 [Lottia gigantea]|uniref:Uncharacterized protein n=1 Tax=Lottia gigantea TaxID=225164 RepID=V3ZNC5_LOTGI|nr:hypothetical protein LOTGIDRAFT_134763 [Lottia gigantea]ESO82326.1 hypothetical protein LOTGIDRAFT_134763 [Lottia gigantea]